MIEVTSLPSSRIIFMIFCNEFLMNCAEYTSYSYSLIPLHLTPYTLTPYPRTYTH